MNKGILLLLNISFKKAFSPYQGWCNLASFKKKPGVNKHLVSENKFIAYNL